MAQARLTQTGAAVEINFAFCQPGVQRFDLAAGVTTFDFLGINGSDCIFDYGHDSANPGLVTMACRVPASTGALQFLVHDGTPDMSGIADRCSVI